TLAPSAANRRTSPSPSPDAPPVTIATLPVSSLTMRPAPFVAPRSGSPPPRGRPPKAAQSAGSGRPLARHTNGRRKSDPRSPPPIRRQEFVALPLDHQRRHGDALVGTSTRRKRRRLQTRPSKPCRRERLPRSRRDAGLVAPLHIRVVGGVRRVMKERLDDAAHAGKRCVVVIE